MKDYNPIEETIDFYLSLSKEERKKLDDKIRHDEFVLMYLILMVYLKK